MTVTLREDLAHQRLRHEERRLRLAVQALEATMSEKRARGHLIPLCLRASYDDFASRLRAVRAQLPGAP